MHAPLFPISIPHLKTPKSFMSFPGSALAICAQSCSGKTHLDSVPNISEQMISALVQSIIYSKKEHALLPDDAAETHFPTLLPPMATIYPALMYNSHEMFETFYTVHLGMCVD